MKFSKEKHLTFEEAVEIMFRQLGDWKIMALATSVNDHVTVRNVNACFTTIKFILKQTKTSEKQNSFLRTPQVALCWSGIQVEGLAENKGTGGRRTGKAF